ncbi:MAG: hypothetical protein J6M14_04515 [Campylobacter sp.]|nr:hypothetical protein [Campylobacter sp.]
MKTNFRELTLLTTMFIAGILVCWIGLLIKQQNRNLENPRYYEYIKNLQYDQNYSGRFAYCANIQIDRISDAKSWIKYYFKHLPKEANFTSQEQIVVDKVKKILDDEIIKDSK